jgi:allantoin racemase
MKILIINPNSSQIVTNSIDNEANNYREEELQIEVVNDHMGPLAIETDYDEFTATNFVVNKFKNHGYGYDAGIIGCFSDPGLVAVKDIIDIPIVGIAEASIHAACLRGGRFSIIAAGGPADISVFYGIVRKYGLESRLASVRYLNLDIEDVDLSKKSLIKQNIDKCVYEDGANAIILGCGAFAGLGRVLARETQVMVMDGIKESITLVRAMAAYRNIDR